MAKHVFLEPAECSQTHTVDKICAICDGGLGLCKVCGGCEGSLPTECPGERMGSALQDAISGGLLDFDCGVWYIGSVWAKYKQYDQERTEYESGTR